MVLPVTTIDSLVEELRLGRVDFIKMDIEGAEQRALVGARTTLTTWRPRLAIAVENLPEDQYRVPELVREAVRCLGAHGDEDQLDAVIPLCAHPDWPVRAEAIQVLADRGATRALPAILKRLDLERDAFVRSVTLQALEKLEAYP